MSFDIRADPRAVLRGELKSVEAQRLAELGENGVLREAIDAKAEAQLSAIVDFLKTCKECPAIRCFAF